MTETGGSESAADDASSGRADGRRAGPPETPETPKSSPALRRKLAEVFGEVLPETTSTSGPRVAGPARPTTGTGRTGRRITTGEPADQPRLPA
ncbi:hypothetical protein BJF85_04855 [Saccharomonospora sp. CUA-673]|uniref:hypothetical protein n=1 Tax=Saccharomonospora sp. CUA-673 TaxID=1904969 RepID=UPI000968220B|nr:hypothetical protein [Saccharomonospora sp. CUA-673]OLT41741.1 hypothetical protein BJF85_04855 [Saccharomonospora sp. CUA-673]